MELGGDGWTNIVDEDVNLAEFLHGRGDGGVDGLVIANIGYSIDDLVASFGGCLEFLLESCEFVLASV